MCNFLHLLESWQFDNCRTATAVLATQVLPLRQCLGFSASQAGLDKHFCHSLPLPPLSCSLFLAPTFLVFLLWESTPCSPYAHFLTLSIMFKFIILSVSNLVLSDLFPIYREIKWDSPVCVMGFRRKEACPKQTDLCVVFQKSTDGTKTCKLNMFWTIWDDNVWYYLTARTLTCCKGHGLKSIQHSDQI